MSAKEKQVVEVQEKLEDIMECPICTETYKDPKILPCIHTFCMICLQETGLKTNKSPGDTMPCPICRTEFTVPEKGFVGLQRNFFMERLIEMKNILNPSSTRVVCDACQEDNDLGAEAEIPLAEMYCADCNQRLCEECCKNHRKYKATKNHRMLSLAGAQVNIPSIVKPYVCEKHENKPLEIYCSSCQDVTCALCFFESHKTHETSPVINVVADFRRIIQENADSIMSHVVDLKHRRKGEDNDKAVFSQKVVDVESEIKRIRQTLPESIEKDCDSLLEQLNSIKEEKIKEIDSQLSDIEVVLASLESYQTYCTQVTTIGSDVDICRAVFNLNTRAAKLKQRYQSLSLEPFPTIWLRKSELSDVMCKSGSNTVGKIEENDNNQSSHAEKKESLIDRISAFVDELNGILDNASDEAKGHVCQSKQIERVLDHSGVCTAETDDKKKHKGEEKKTNEVDGIEKKETVEIFETTISDEMTEWTMHDEKFSDKLKELKIKINNLVETNKQLKNELDLQRKQVSRLEEESISANRKAQVVNLPKIKSNEGNIDLRKQVAPLKSIAYDGAKAQGARRNVQRKTPITSLETIKAVDVPNQDTFRVTGLAILDDELFIASKSNVVEVNDMRTLKFKRQWRAKEMGTVMDMKASVRNKHLYLMCAGNFRERLRITEAHMLICCATGAVVAKWKLLDVNIDRPNVQISVTDESNVLLTNGNRSELMEYSSDGKLIRVISLKWESGIQNLSHGIKVTSDHFVVCHGNGEDSRHRVCMVDIDGNVLKNFNEPRRGHSTKLNNPIYLEMAADGKIFVADHLNHRLLLLYSSLVFKQQLSQPDSQYRFYDGLTEYRPRKMILDEASGRIFVVENVWKGSGSEECDMQYGDREYKTQYGDRLLVYTFSF